MKVTGLLRLGWLTDTFLVESYDPETGILVFDFDNPDFYPWGDYEMIPWDDTPEDDIEYNEWNYVNMGDRGWAVLGFEDRFDDSVFFHNLSDQLDQQGEYWIDPDTMILYVYNPDGDYCISRDGTFMTVETGADYINFVGLEFNGSTDTAVYSNADHITFDLCEFRNISGEFGLFASGVHNLTVSNCEFHKLGSECLRIISDADRANLISGNNVVYNNYFHVFSFLDYWKNGMQLYNDVGAVISHNVFERGAHGGVRYDDSLLCIIEYNIFDGLMVSTQDLGCVYTYRAGVYWGNEIRYNLFKNMEALQKYPVYLDDVTSGQKVYGNICYQCGDGFVSMTGGQLNEIYDNIMIQDSLIISEDYESKAYAAYTSNTIDEFCAGSRPYNDLMGIGTVKPEEGQVGYEIWKATFPLLYSYHFDTTRINEPQCLFNGIIYCRNNAMITTSGVNELQSDGPIVFEDNIYLTRDENPLFVNPTIGDYRIREDADFFKIPFEKMGRE